MFSPWGNEMNTKQSSILLFLIGLFAATRVFFIGTIGISEIPVLLCAPFIFLKDYRVLRHDGFLPVIIMPFLVLLGGTLNVIINHTSYIILAKHCALVYSIPAFIVVFHRLLRNNLRGLRWALLGFALSMVIKSFAFNPTAAVDSNGVAMLDSLDIVDSINSPIFWSSRLKILGIALIGGWYDSLPVLFNIGYVGATSVFVALSSVSGRASMATFFFGMIISVIGGKTSLGIKKVQRHFVVALLVLGCLVVLMKSVYGHFASAGALGEKARIKYELQTRQGSGILQILMAGRVEFFVGLRAMVDSPIFGYGLIPVDRKGYYLEFIKKYGDFDDIERYYKDHVYQNLDGVEMIPSHSYIIGFWMYYGMMGFILWLYVLHILFMYFKRYAASVPYLFGFLSLSIPGVVWAIFFSPYAERFLFPLVFTCVLFARAAYKGKYLPQQ